jgi:hypothetical protein
VTTTEYIRLATAILVSIVCAAGIWYLWRPAKEAHPDTPDHGSKKRSRATKVEAPMSEPAPVATTPGKRLSRRERRALGEASPAAAEQIAAGEEAAGEEAAVAEEIREVEVAAVAEEVPVVEETVIGEETLANGVSTTEPRSTEESTAPTAPAEPALLDGLFDLNRLQRENDELLGRDWFGEDEKVIATEEQPPAQPAGTLPDSLGAMIGRAAISAASAGSGAKVDPLQLLFAQTPLTEGAVVSPEQTEPAAAASNDHSETSGPSIAGSDDSWDASASEVQVVDQNAVRDEQKRVRRLDQAERRRIKAQKRRDRRAKNRDARQTEQRPPTKGEIRKELRNSARTVKRESARARREERTSQKRQLKDDQHAMRANQRDAQKAAALKLGLATPTPPADDAWATALTTAPQQPVVAMPAPLPTSATPAALAVQLDEAATAALTGAADVWPAEDPTHAESSPEAAYTFERDGGAKQNVLDQLFGEVVAMSEPGQHWADTAAAAASAPQPTGPSYDAASSQAHVQDPWSAASSDGAAAWPSQVAVPAVAPVPSHDAFGLPEPLPARNAPFQ